MSTSLICLIIRFDWFHQYLLLFSNTYACTCSNTTCTCMVHVHVHVKWNIICIVHVKWKYWNHSIKNLQQGHLSSDNCKTLLSTVPTTYTYIENSLQNIMDTSLIRTLCALLSQKCLRFHCTHRIWNTRDTTNIILYVCIISYNTSSVMIRF